MMTLFVVVAVLLLVLVKCSCFYALLFLLLVCLAHTHFTQKSPSQLSNSSYLFDSIYVSRTFLLAHARTKTCAAANLTCPPHTCTHAHTRGHAHPDRFLSKT